MPFFAAGIVAYFAFRRLSHWTPRARRLLSVSLVMFAILLIAGIAVDGPVRRLLYQCIRRTSFYIWGVPFACLVLSQAIYPLRVLTNKVTRFLGEISYSLYMIHPWIILMCRPMYLYIQNTQKSVPLFLLFAALATFTILLPLSWLTHRLIEVPGMNWGKRMSARKATSAAPPAPAQ